MALIECPECGREISDKVKSCPHCGYPFEEDSTQETTKEPQQVEVTGVKLKKGNYKKTLIIIFSILAVALIAYFGIRYFNQRKVQQEYEGAFNTYIDNINKIRLLTIMGGADAESLGNLTLQVWRNSIYEERDEKTDEYTRPNGFFVDDFNVALYNLFSANSTKSTIDDIETNQDEVQKIMKELQNPPEGLEKCYETVTELYTAYKGLTDLAINPTGNLTTFSETFTGRV